MKTSASLPVTLQRSECRPLTSIGFVITALAAKFVLKEEISWVRWLGVVCIVIGAGIITWSEKLKERKADQVPPSASSGQPNQ